jgi:hypothetical protein
MVYIKRGCSAFGQYLLVQLYPTLFGNQIRPPTELVRNDQGNITEERGNIIHTPRAIKSSYVRCKECLTASWAIGDGYCRESWN